MNARSTGAPATRRKSSELAIPPELETRLGIEKWAGSYPVWERDMDKWIAEMLQSSREGKKYLTPEEMRALATWKSNKRTYKDLENNEAGRIEERTKAAFSYRGGDPKEHIKLLVGISGKPETGIHGVNIATASSFLHFAFPGQYPVIDRLALRAMGMRENKQNLGVWHDYAEVCLQHAGRRRVTLRTLDRALWQLGKEIEELERTQEKRKWPYQQ